MLVVLVDNDSAEPGDSAHPPAAEAMSNPGQSGNPDSPFYENLFDP